MRPRTTRPKPVATLAVTKLPATAHTVPIIATTSIIAPISRIRRVSPGTMPWSTMSAISRGRYRLAKDCARASTITTPIEPRNGRRNLKSLITRNILLP